MTTMPGNKSKIEYAGLSEKVTEWLFKDNLSYQDILEKLKNEYNIDLTIGSITRFRKFVLDSVPEFLRHDEEYRNKLAKVYLDTVDNLVELRDEIKTKIEDFKNKEDWKQHATYLSMLLPLVQMLLKRAGEIKPAQFIEKQEINMIQINQMVQMELVRLIDEGQIPVESCSEQIKEFYKKMKNV